MPCDKKNKSEIEEASDYNINDDQVVKNLLKRVQAKLRGKNPVIKTKTAQDLANSVLDTDTAVQKMKIAGKKKDAWGMAKEAAKPEKGEDQKEKEVPIETLQKRLSGSQQFKQFVAKLKTMSSSAERAKAVQGLLDGIPKQDDQYKQTQKNYFER